MVKKKKVEVDKKEKIEAKPAQKQSVLRKIKSKMTPGRTIILSAVVLLVLLFATLGYLIYGARNESSFVRSATAVVPFPAQIIDGKYISVNQYLKQLETRKKYYQEFKKVDFNSEDGRRILSEQRQSVIDQLAEEAIVAKEAKKQGIKLDKKEVNDEYDRLIASNSGKEGFSETIKKYYGLTIEEFKSKIFVPGLLRQKLTEKINNEEAETGVAKKRIEEILAKAKAGEDFAKLATETSQDEGSAADGGNVGFFAKGKMVPEFEKAAFEAKEGEIVGPIKSAFGYHIIKVTGKKGAEVRASHILIKTRDFNEWLAEKKSELKNKKYLGFIPAYWTLINVK